MSVSSTVVVFSNRSALCQMIHPCTTVAIKSLTPLNLYYRHEGAIDLYMASKHRNAYLFTAEEKVEDVEEVISENWWPATRVVCDIGAPKFDDPDQFVADLRRAVEHLASGGKIVDGELK